MSSCALHEVADTQETCHRGNRFVSALLQLRTPAVVSTRITGLSWAVA